jgi:hypothetical protein
MDERSGIPAWFMIDVTLIVVSLIIIGIGVWIGL